MRKNNSVLTPEGVDRIGMLFSYKDDNTGRKGYDIVVEEIDGYIITDGQKLADCICAFVCSTDSPPDTSTTFHWHCVLDIPRISNRFSS